MTQDYVTRRCQAWVVTRQDGVQLGFTDHDVALTVDGVPCQAASGFDAMALERSNGLSVDNAEAIGALTSDAISEADIDAGRYDNAQITLWRLDWSMPEEAECFFRGTIGQITRVDGAFRAELRGPSEALNQMRGHVFQSGCGAVLGDVRCGVDLSHPDFHLKTSLATPLETGVVKVLDPTGYPARWFERGVLLVAKGLGAGEYRVKLDETVEDGKRRLTLWTYPTEVVESGTNVTLLAGCDKQFTTCRTKFSNISNFRGFPHIPGEDWITAYPNSNQAMDGGRL